MNRRHMTGDHHGRMAGEQLCWSELWTRFSARTPLHSPLLPRGADPVLWPRPRFGRSRQRGGDGSTAGIGPVRRIMAEEAALRAGLGDRYIEYSNGRQLNSARPQALPLGHPADHQTAQVTPIAGRS